MSMNARRAPWLSVLLICALLMPWCLMACEQGLMNTPSPSLAVSAVPPCHAVSELESVMVSNDEHSIMVHTDCFACSQDISLTLSDLLLITVWSVTEFWSFLSPLGDGREVVAVVQPPPPLPSSPLFWQHVLLLI